jgi:hypothetical protein
MAGDQPDRVPYGLAEPMPSVPADCDHGCRGQQAGGSRYAYEKLPSLMPPIPLNPSKCRSETTCSTGRIALA